LVLIISFFKNPTKKKEEGGREGGEGGEGLDSIDV
jgi:hypothetical protein